MNYLVHGTKLDISPEIIIAMLKRVWQQLIDFMFCFSISSINSGKTVFQPVFGAEFKVLSQVYDLFLKDIGGWTYEGNHLVHRRKTGTVLPF